MDLPAVFRPGGFRFQYERLEGVSGGKRDNLRW
jgi:hypothetical protein